MRKHLFTFLISLFFLGGCSNKPLLFFNDQPVTRETIDSPKRTFKNGEKIYYILIVPKGFKDDYIRVQLVKKSEKTEHWGYNIYWSKDFHIDKSEKYFTSYVIPGEPGYYFMQIFSFNDFDMPVTRNDFWVK